MINFLDDTLSEYIAAFRKKYNCQAALIRLTENWKQSLEAGNYIGTILMDLSKAFDCLPHSLLLAKLKAYGMNTSSVQLIASYLRNRKQRVRISNSFSDWSYPSKGVPQGSILGPALFNTFINDLFFAIKRASLVNFADDNSIFTNDKSIEQTVSLLVDETRLAIDWFDINYMQANPEKFQGMIISNRSHDTTELDVDGTIIKCETCVKLLGVWLDNNLNFNKHIAELCKKAGRQLNALKRLSKYLNESTKMCIYKSFILCHFNYCPLVWHNTTKTNTDKLEKIQERALRFVLNDFTSDYANLLLKASVPSLTLSRLRQLSTEIYKSLHGLSPPFICSMFSDRFDPHRQKIHIPCPRTTKAGIRSLAFQGAKIWNSLPKEFKTAPYLKIFKTLIKTWKGPTCSCNFCRSSLYVTDH